MAQGDAAEQQRIRSSRRGGMSNRANDMVYGMAQWAKTAIDKPRTGGIKPAPAPTPSPSPSPADTPAGNNFDPTAGPTGGAAGGGVVGPMASQTSDTTFQNPRFQMPQVDVKIDPDAITAPGAVRSDVQTISPPQDIEAATIGDYTPYVADERQLGDEATVEGRLSGLLSQNNPYIDRARTRADQLANRRGMLNTSMAAGAAEGAAIDRALPIAQQDARAMMEQSFLNQGYSNEAARHLADSSIQRENLQAGLEQQTRESNVARGFEAARLDQAAENRANEMYAQEQNKQAFAQLSADLQGQLKRIDSDLAMRLESLTREYGLLENLDSIRGSIYQQMVAEMGTILANEEKASVANAKINALIDKAGVEMSFSDGVISGSGQGSGPNAGASAIPPRPGPNYRWNDKKWRWEKKPTIRFIGNNDRGGGGGIGGDNRGGGGGSGIGGSMGGGDDSSGGSVGGQGGDSSGGDGSGCFSGDTEFLMADGTYKAIKDIKVGDVTLGGVVTGTRSGPSDRLWFDYLGSKVTDEHFVFESDGWKYVKDSPLAIPIDAEPTYYTCDTTDHVLHGINGALFSDDAVFDSTHWTHQMPYGKEQWDEMLKILNERFKLEGVA